MGFRILLTHDFYPPFIGGAEHQVQLLSRQLALRGHEVSVATVWHPSLPREEEDCGVRVYRLKGLLTNVPWFFANRERRYHPPFPDLGIVWGLRRIINSFEPDVVHAAGWIAYSCAAALFGKPQPLLLSARDYCYICAVRDFLFEDRVCDGPTPMKCLRCATAHYGPLKGAAATLGIIGFRRLLLGKTRGIHSVSSFVQSTMRRDLLKSAGSTADSGRHRITDVVIPSFLSDIGGVEDTNATPPDGLPDQPYILFVGALQPSKGLLVLLKAYSRLTAAPPLVLIGTMWHDWSVALPPGVILIRDVPHSSVMAAWERCLFGVAPSLCADALPGVVREAMSKGKAMIATAVGGMPDMIEDGINGLLVPPGDVDALSQAIKRLMEEPQLRNKLGRAAQCRAAVYTADRILPQFEQLYSDVIASHNHSLTGP